MFVVVARHGWSFGEPFLRKHFERDTEWYIPAKDNGAVRSQLNEVERRNLEMIEALERERGGPYGPAR